MARGARHGPRPVPIDMGANKIENLGRSSEEDGAARIDDIPVCSAFLPLPDGIAAKGSEGKWADGLHVHPLTAQGFAPVVALCGCELTEEHSTFEDWTQGPTGTWTRNMVGPFDTGNWTDGVTIAKNDRIFVGDIGITVTGVYAGPYEVLEPGTSDPEVNAVIRRTTDANESSEFHSGMSCLVTGGTLYHGKTLVLATPDPIDLDVTSQQWLFGSGGVPGGVIVHNNTLHRDALDCHPASAITPTDGGWVGDGDQWITMPIVSATTRSSSVRWSPTSPANLLGISKKWGDGTDIPQGFEIGVYIASASPSNIIQVTDGATPPPATDNLPLALPAVDGIGDVMGLDGPTELKFKLDQIEWRWHLIASVTYTVMPT